MTFKNLAILVAFFCVLFNTQCKKAINPKVKLPEITTNEPSIITQTSAYCGGRIINNDGEDIIARGICWNNTGNPTVADNNIIVHKEPYLGNIHFRTKISGLLKYTTYYVRAYAINRAGTVYGNEQSFYTIEQLETNPIVDKDGNSYNTVKIGNQIWMASSLLTTTLNNGKMIPNVEDGKQWASLLSEGQCTYDNTENLDSIVAYGRLYNWYAVKTDELCPNGWHVPSVNDFHELSNYLEGEDLAGGKLKEVGTTHWHNPNTGADNESGFTALPSGYRELIDDKPIFGSKGNSSIMWTSIEVTQNSKESFTRDLSWADSEIKTGSGDKKSGFSVRCIKN